MFINVKTSSENEKLAPQIQYFLKEILADFELKNESITLEGVDNLYELFDQDKIFLIQDGMLNLHTTIKCFAVLTKANSSVWPTLSVLTTLFIKRMSLLSLFLSTVTTFYVMCIPISAASITGATF